MTEDYLFYCNIILFKLDSFILKNDGKKVDQLDCCVKIVIDFSLFYLNEFIINVIFNFQIYSNIKHVLDHIIILTVNKLENIFSCYVEVRVLGNCHFKLETFGIFRNFPGIVHELFPCPQIWIYNHRKEIVLVYHVIKTLFQVLETFFSHIFVDFFLNHKSRLLLLHAFTFIRFDWRKEFSFLIILIDIVVGGLAALRKITFAELVFYFTIFLKSTI